MIVSRWHSEVVAGELDICGCVYCILAYVCSSLYLLFLHLHLHCVLVCVVSLVCVEAELLHAACCRCGVWLNGWKTSEPQIMACN